MPDTSRRPHALHRLLAGCSAPPRRPVPGRSNTTSPTSTDTMQVAGQAMPLTLTDTNDIRLLMRVEAMLEFYTQQHRE